MSLINPELDRREFIMKGTFRLVNLTAFVTMGGFLGALPVLAGSSGHLQSLTCYECRACASQCPWKFDPAGFVLAARTSNPARRMLIQLDLRSNNEYNYNNIVASRDPDKKVTLARLNKLDPQIRVKVAMKDDITGAEVEQRIMTVKDALAMKMGDEQLLETYDMKASDAAFFCTLCTNCDPKCPVDIRVTDYIRDLKANGRFF